MGALWLRVTVFASIECDETSFELVMSTARSVHGTGTVSTWHDIIAVLSGLHSSTKRSIKLGPSKD